MRLETVEQPFNICVGSIYSQAEGALKNVSQCVSHDHSGANRGV